MRKLSRRTLATVARQFVVQEALETSSCLAGSYFCSLPLRTTVMSGSLAGAVMMTFLAPAWRCSVVVALSRKTPVDSATMSTPSSPHGRVAGSFAEQTRTSRPLTKIASPLCRDRKSTRLNSSHVRISYAVFCLKKKKKTKETPTLGLKKYKDAQRR